MAADPRFPDGLFTTAGRPLVNHHYSVYTNTFDIPCNRAKMDGLTILAD